MGPIPKFQRALVATGPSKVTLRRAVAIPTCDSCEVLIKTAAVALNPSDYKLLDISVTPGAISGSDVAGTVVHIGSEVKNLQVGDRVFGVIFGANPGRPGNGAFSEYVAATASLCLKIPDHMRFAEAASMGMGLMTTGLCFRALDLEFDAQARDCERPFVLVHGGATATGTLAIQLLRISGYKPIATCSPRNFELVKNAGALEAFDYNSSSCREDIRAFTSGGVPYAIDTIGSQATLLLCYGVIMASGGKYTALEHYPKRLTLRRRNVKHNWVLGWTLFGKPVQLGGAYARPALPEDLQFGSEWVKLMNPLLEARRIKPHPLDIDEGGLQAVLPRLDILREGRVSGKKLVCTIPAMLRPRSSKPMSM